MEKTIIEKRIEEKAKDRFEKDLINAEQILKNHPILSSLKIGELKLVSVNSCNYSKEFFNRCHTELLEEKTNFNKIKENLIQKYIKEETDNLLAKLDNIKYLFDDLQ